MLQIQFLFGPDRCPEERGETAEGVTSRRERQRVVSLSFAIVHVTVREIRNLPRFLPSLSFSPPSKKKLANFLLEVRARMHACTQACNCETCILTA